jgi:hypothetical protein
MKPLRLGALSLLMSSGPEDIKPPIVDRLTGRKDEINEINIGARLFGRPDYDPSIDGIVR